MKNKLFFILALVITLSACSSNKTKQYAIPDETMASDERYAGNAMTNGYVSPPIYQDDYDIALEPAIPGTANMTASYGDSAGIITDASKVILTGNVAIETNQFDAAVANIRNLLAFYKGYMSNSNIGQYTDDTEALRHYKATLKIPAESFDSAFEQIKAISGTKSASQYQENVSEQYSNTESRLATRKVEEERLLNMISKATEISDLLGLERRLAQVRTDINIYEAQLKNINLLVSYSTLNVNISEVKTGTSTLDKGFIDRVIGGFKASLRLMLSTAQGITFVVAASALPLAVFAFIVFLLVVIIRKIVYR